MVVLNIMWGFNLGGVGKCFLAYAGLGKVDSRLTVHTACINLKRESIELAPLREIGATVIDIKGRLDFSWLPRCKQLIDAVKPDVIFTHGFNGPVMVQAIRLRYRLKIPMLCSYHGEYHPPRPNRRFIAPLFNNVMHALYRSRRVSRVVTVADYCKQFLVACGVPQEKISVVHNGISNNSIHSVNSVKKNWEGLFSSAFVVGMASRIEPIKGIEEAIDAIHTIHSERQSLNIKLVILGEGPQRGHLEEKVKQLGLEKVVFFKGVQSNVGEWMEAFDVFLLPSYFEYHSIAILEAMRAGKAIVATAVGGTPESIRHEQEGLLVPARDVQALSDALMRLGGDKQLREALGAAAHERFELEFTEAVMQRKLADWLLCCESPN